MNLLKTALESILKPIVKKIVLGIIENKLDDEYEKIRSSVAREGLDALDKAFDGLQHVVISALQKNWIKRILPDSLEDLIRKAVQEEGDKMQAKAHAELEEKGLAGLDALYNIAKTAIISKVQSI